jgi:hypothetical protein
LCSTNKEKELKDKQKRLLKDRQKKVFIKHGRPFMGRSKKKSIVMKKVEQKITPEELDQKFYLGMII